MASSEVSEDSIAPSHLEPELEGEVVIEQYVSTSISEVSSPNDSQSRLNLNDEGPMLYDPSLPPGWCRKVQQRTMGASAGKYDVYIYSPDNKKIRSRTDLTLYLEKNNLDLNPDDFDFSVRGRGCAKVIKKEKPSKKLTPKLPKVPKLKIRTPVSGQTQHREPESKKATVVGQETHNIPPGPKMVVKFEFPVPRLKRSMSMKSKTKKSKTKKPSPSSENGDDQEMMPYDNNENVDLYKNSADTNENVMSMSEYYIGSCDA